MANQRISLRCLACGEEKFIAKRSMSAFYTIRREHWQQEWDNWFEKHEWGFCDPEGGCTWSLDIFELVYEHVDKDDGHPSGV